MAGRGGEARPDSDHAAMLSRAQSRSIEKLRKRLLKELPYVLTSLLEKAKGGSLPHIKLLLQLAGLEAGGLASRDVKPQGKSLEEILMEQWANEP